MTSNYFVKLHFNQAIAQKTNYAFKVGDKGCTFHLHCEDHDPTDMLPHIVFNRSDGTCVEGTPIGSGRDYTYTVMGNEFGVCGKTVVDLKFYDADPATQRISTASFIIDVIPDTLTPFDTPPSPYADSLEQAREELEDATEDLANMDSLFAQTLQDYIDAFGNTAPINPRGAYNPAALYNPRDAVYYTVNNKTVTYMNNLECTGVLPTNTSNWQPLFDIAVIPAIIDNCESTSTTDALAANQGRLIADNLAANENVYGAKNVIPYPFYHTTRTDNGITFTDNGDGTITVSGTAIANVGFFITINPNNEKKIDYEYPLVFTGTPSNSYGITTYVDLYDSNNQFYQEITDSGAGGTLPTGYYPYSIGISVPSGANITTPIVIKPMLRDARIFDATFVRGAKTNLQLTADKAERNDLSTIHATGSTNTTGVQIDAGTFFYLNGSYCKAIADIANGATFTLNTNFKVANVSDEISEKTLTVTAGTGVTINNSIFKQAGHVIAFLLEFTTSSALSQYGGIAKIDGTWTSIIANYFNVISSAGAKTNYMLYIDLYGYIGVGADGLPAGSYLVYGFAFVQ